MERHLKLTIAGHGSIGHYIEDLFAPLHSINIYDPPLGFNEADTLVDTDFVLICAPTPSNEDGSCNTTIVEHRRPVTSMLPRIYGWCLCLDTAYSKLAVAGMLFHHWCVVVMCAGAHICYVVCVVICTVRTVEFMIVHVNP